MDSQQRPCSFHYSTRRQLNIYMNKGTSSSQKHIDTLHDVIAIWVVRSLLARNLHHGRYHGLIIVHKVANVIGDLHRKITSRENKEEIITMGRTTVQRKGDSSGWEEHEEKGGSNWWRRGDGARITFDIILSLSHTHHNHRLLTCWLIKTIPISFEEVNFRNASSICDRTVVFVTVRKLLVACDVSPTPAKRKPETVSSSPMTAIRRVSIATVKILKSVLIFCF